MGGMRQGGAHRVRSTLQRDAIARLLQSSDRFRTAQEIHLQLRSAGETAGLTTVYRHLQIFVDEGVVHTVRLDDRQIAYRWCGQSAHHHHLVCRRCGVSHEFIDAESERRIAQAVEIQGFTELDHNLDVFGVCPKCQQ
jgi:Fur family transcriptional regulator, ferric uptake regulator